MKKQLLFHLDIDSIERDYDTCGGLAPRRFTIYCVLMKNICVA